MGLFIGLDEQGQRLGQLGQGMRFVLADLIEYFIENGQRPFDSLSRTVALTSAVKQCSLLYNFRNASSISGIAPAMGTSKLSLAAEL